MTQKSLLTFLATQGQTDGAVNEREYNFLLGQGIGKKHLNEMWFQYLRNQGYTGSLSDMFLKWLEDDSLTNLSMSGLDTSAPTDAATIGDHASITVGFPVGVTSWTSEAWGVGTYGDTTYGTGSSPSDYTASDGQSLLWEGIGDDGNTYRASAAIKYAPAVNTVQPNVSGSTGLGDTLTTDNGTWTGATGGSYSYQWQRNGVDISGETSNTYVIVVADDAANIRCVVTYTNSGGAVSANSNTRAVEDFSPPVITGVPTISGTESVGSTLTATPASTSGTPTPTTSWIWYKTGSLISGALSSTYTLVPADEGETITVQQTETNALGSDSATSAATGTISAGDTQEPIIGTFTVDQPVDDIEVTLDMADTGEDNNFAYIVGVSNGESAPSQAQIKAGLKNNGSNAPFWLQGYLFTGDLTDEAVSFTRFTHTSGSFDWYAVVSDDEPNDSAVASAINVTIDTTVETGDLAFDDNPTSTGAHESFDDNETSTGTHESLSDAA